MVDAVQVHLRLDICTSTNLKEISLVSTTAPSHCAFLDRVFAGTVSIFAEPSVGEKEASFTKANVF